MTEFEITHGLSQDHPGPLEPLEVAKVAAVSVAAGWKLVPKRPTKAMQDAWDSAPFNEDTDAEFRDAYGAMIEAAPTPPSSVAQGDAQDELATYSLQPLATAFFTEKGEVAYTGIYDRTLKALEAVKTTRMGISAGSIDLYARPHAPAAGDALALLDHPLLRNVLGYIEDAGPADVWGSAQAWMALRDAAIAAQRKGDA